MSNAPATGVRYFEAPGIEFVVETRALVLNLELQLVVIHVQRQIHVLVFVKFVAVADGVVNGFRDSYHNIAVDVVLNVERVFGVINEALHDADVFHKRRNLNFNLLHKW